MKVLPVEQGHRFFYGWIFRRNRKGVQIFMGPEKISQSIFEECENYARIGDAGGLTSHRGGERCKRRRETRFKTLKERIR